LKDGIAAAKVGGFDAVEFGASEVADLVEAQGADAVKGLFAEAGLKPAFWGLPTDWRGDEAKWKDSLKELPRLAKAAAAIGGTRTGTWIISGSNDKPFGENYRFHVERFKPIAQILADHGCCVGLEFLGPRTIRKGLKYQFIWRMLDMAAMGQEIGPNCGLLLDAWHWYTGEDTVDHIRELKAEQVAYVHVNDAPAGVDILEQRDNVRMLPGETGVIDIAGFLQALKAIGYDGPVTPEPFKQNLKEMPSDEARLKAVGASMDDIFKKAGLR
jgi:sugar phosphate isomerase/epimerase